jgi:penicillin-binding protein 1A
MALAKSLNVVAAELSFAVGREKVIEMTQRLGITGIRKSCSMALGDYGITPLEHAGGVATFANGGKRARPYAILEVTNSKGELVYSRERDEPEAPQVVSRPVVEQMNFMLNKVILEGTGTKAQLDFTNVAGKTGTSTGPKDIWFVGFTGKYVGAVWLGNDDNRPMMAGNTGGGLAAPVWHSVMAVAHSDMNIPTIPGLPPHPVQVAEQQRLAALRRTDSTLASLNQPGGPVRKTSSVMPDQTRESLKRLVQTLRKASGVPADTPGQQPEKPVPATVPQPAPAVNRRADSSNPTGSIWTNQLLGQH